MYSRSRPLKRYLRALLGVTLVLTIVLQSIASAVPTLAASVAAKKSGNVVMLDNNIACYQNNSGSVVPGRLQKKVGVSAARRPLDRTFVSLDTILSRRLKSLKKKRQLKATRVREIKYKTLRVWKMNAPSAKAHFPPMGIFRIPEPVIPA